jgi:hypothetical protein
MRSVRRRASAWVTLAAFVCAFGLQVASPQHIGGDDDLACGPSSLSGHSARFETSQPPVKAEHCAVCHWWRDIGRAVATPIDASESRIQPAELLGAPDVLARVQNFSWHLASRGPPSTSCPSWS